MPVTAKLSKRFYDALREDVANVRTEMGRLLWVGTSGLTLFGVAEVARGRGRSPRPLSFVRFRLISDPEPASVPIV